MQQRLKETYSKSPISCANNRHCKITASFLVNTIEGQLIRTCGMQPMKFVDNTNACFINMKKRSSQQFLNKGRVEGLEVIITFFGSLKQYGFTDRLPEQIIT